MQLITSMDNKYVKLASSLKQRKYREEQQMFLVEGRRAAVEVLARPDLVEVVFVDNRLAEDYALLSNFNPDHLFQIDSKLMRHICSTENPQGIAVIIKKPAWSWDEVAASQGLLLLLDRLADPGNMGSILRSAWAFGVSGVLLNRGCVDPFSPKVVRASMGAILNLPVITEVSEGQLDSLQVRGYRLLATDIDSGQSYYRVKYDKPALIVIGSEAEGVSENIKQRCQKFINIPMNPQVDSLNVAAACAIIIAEAWRQYLDEIELA